MSAGHSVALWAVLMVEQTADYLAETKAAKTVVWMVVTRALTWAG